MIAVQLEANSRFAVCDGGWSELLGTDVAARRISIRNRFSPDLPGEPERIRWSFGDPVATTGTVDERQRAFNNIATQLVNRVRIWMSLPSIGGRGRL
jgi:hypothetical protein